VVTNIYCIYAFYVLHVLYLTDQLAVRGLSADLSVIYGSTCLAVLILLVVSFYASCYWYLSWAILVQYFYFYFLLIYFYSILVAG